MAEIINKDHSNKFLDLHGVEILWNKVKEQIQTVKDSATAASKLESVSYSSEIDKLTVQVGGVSQSAEIAKASADNNGLMSSDDFKKLSGIAASAQVNVIEGVAIAAVSATDHANITEVVDKYAVLRVVTELDNVTEEANPIQPASALAAKTYADKLADAAADARKTLSDNIDTVSGVAKANADAIAALQTNTASYALKTDLNTVSASVAANAKAIADHATEFTTYQDTVTATLEQLESRISSTASELATRITTLENISATHTELLEDLRTDVDANATAIEKAVSDAADALAAAKDELKANIGDVSDAVAVLNSDSSVTGSVDYKVKSAIDAVVNGADDAFDTLKEVADWILTDESGASAMASEIAKLKTDKLDVSAFNTFKDANTATLGQKVDTTTFKNTIDLLNTNKADTTYVNEELAKKVNTTVFEAFKEQNTTNIGNAVGAEKDSREAADSEIKAAAVTNITSSYSATSGRLSINYAFIDSTSATSFVLCESISDDDLNKLFEE